MTFPGVLYALLIGPLETMFEALYTAAYIVLENPGLSIIALSLIMNLLLLPLYRQTDAIQAEAIETEKRLKPYVDHIKKTFKGDERFMMLQTCYRQNHYKPTDALKGVSPLMLEIPFFMAAYNFLSHLEILQNMDFGPIPNLGAPDGLLVLGGLSFNLLPILMTVINLISSVIYTKGAPLKTKLQLYGMAALFLVLLYDSSAGLAFYWTLNNLFSLVKNALMKTPKPGLSVGILGLAASLLCAGYALVNLHTLTARKALFWLGSAVLLLLPLALWLGRARRGSRVRPQVTVTSGEKKLFYGCCAFLTVLIGLMIPAALIRSSPEEFILRGTALNPNSYLLHTGLLAAGVFLVWLVIFYQLAPAAGKRLMGLATWLACGVSVVDYMFFGKSYGTMSASLIFDRSFENQNGREMLINLAVLAVVVPVLYGIWHRKPALARTALAAALLAVVGMTGLDVVQSQRLLAPTLEQLREENARQTEEKVFRLSRTGKNVVILMMDRAVNSYVPYIFNERPELQQQFAGFTYFPNTISFGGHTNVGEPAVFGGYEYRPQEINKRTGEALVDKHNESMMVLPVLFDSEGFDTTVSDPTYVGYSWLPDLSIYEPYPGIRTHITDGRFSASPEEMDLEKAEGMQRNLFFYSLFKASPVLAHEYIYDDGRYLEMTAGLGQVCSSLRTARGGSDEFASAYDVMDHFRDLTEILDEDVNTFAMMCNNTSHAPALLQLPDYLPMDEVDNTAFEKENPERSLPDGTTLVMDTLEQVQHYHCNAATYLQLGRWLDYLREQGVYDNTRIIVVSDHGFNLNQFDRLRYGTEPEDDAMFYNPVLMVKDFDADELTEDGRFMTNADVPTIAAHGLIEEPVNPFTGKTIDREPAHAPLQYVFASHDFDILVNNGNTFLPGDWLEVKNHNALDGANWSIVDESRVS